MSKILPAKWIFCFTISSTYSFPSSTFLCLLTLQSCQLALITHVSCIIVQTMIHLPLCIIVHTFIHLLSWVISHILIHLLSCIIVHALMYPVSLCILWHIQKLYRLAISPHTEPLYWHIVCVKCNANGCSSLNTFLKSSHKNIMEEGIQKVTRWSKKSNKKHIRVHSRDIMTSWSFFTLNDDRWSGLLWDSWIVATTTNIFFGRKFYSAVKWPARQMLPPFVSLLLIIS